MITVAVSREIEFKIPNKTHYSFFNSPYTPHRGSGAIDVYFNDGYALYPLEEGKVSEIRKIKTPRNINCSEDFLILVDCLNGMFLKILHVEPIVNMGDILYLGDPLGKLIPSGYFFPWTDLHAHFELRKCGDKYRARGGEKLNPLIIESVPVAQGEDFVVVEKKDKYCWIKPLHTNPHGLTPISCGMGFVDGGFPHYGYYVCIGKNLKIHPANFEVFANGIEIKGLGVYCNFPYVKLIGNHFNEGDVVKITCKGDGCPLL